MGELSRLIELTRFAEFMHPLIIDYNSYIINLSSSCMYIFSIFSRNGVVGERKQELSNVIGWRKNPPRTSKYSVSQTQ